MPPRPRLRLSGVISGKFDFEARAAALFLLPVTAVLVAVAVFPIGYSFYISLFQLKLTRPHRVPFVWLDNYAKILTDELFWSSAWRTFSFTVMSVVAISILVVLIALLLNETFRGRRFLATMLVAPWAIPTVANGLMWKWIYDSSFGALNGALSQLGIID